MKTLFNPNVEAKIQRIKTFIKHTKNTQEREETNRQHREDQTTTNSSYNTQNTQNTQQKNNACQNSITTRTQSATAYCENNTETTRHKTKLILTEQQIHRGNHIKQYQKDKKMKQTNTEYKETIQKKKQGGEEVRVPTKDSNNLLTPAWQRIFTKTMQPPNIKEQAETKKQLPKKARKATLQQNENKALGDEMTPAHKDIRIWSVNANTLLLHDDLAELNELCISI